LFQKVTSEKRNSPEYQELKEIELDNLDFIDSKAEDDVALPGAKN
jgi:hypothetical protein